MALCNVLGLLMIIVLLNCLLCILCYDLLLLSSLDFVFFGYLNTFDLFLNLWKLIQQAVFLFIFFVYALIFQLGYLMMLLIVKLFNFQCKRITLFFFRTLFEDGLWFDMFVGRLLNLFMALNLYLLTLLDLFRLKALLLLIFYYIYSFFFLIRMFS